ncbi:cell wall-binding repeat-containing protein [Clostridium sp.]|uniref:cell wall-binding repeat-containing protein n=1 Tax=Clostridium sp. TaxID=1506 RepID=UPI003D6D0FCE
MKIRKNKRVLSIFFTAIFIMLNILNVTKVKAQDTYKYINEWKNKYDFPLSMSVDASGNFYFVDAHAQCIEKFNSDGKSIIKFGGYTICAAVDHLGNVYSIAGVGDDGWGNIGVIKYDSNGKYITKWSVEGLQFNKGVEINGIAVDTLGNVYICSGNSGGRKPSRIQKFNSNGKYITQWEVKSNGSLATDILGNVYVAYSGGTNMLTDDTIIYLSSYIEKFDPNGKSLAKWETDCSVKGEYKFTGITVDNSGNIYVTDFKNKCIQKFDSNGNYLTQWVPNQSNGQEHYLQAPIAADGSGNIYIWTRSISGSCIQKFSLAQTIKQTILVNNGSDLNLTKYLSLNGTNLTWQSSNTAVATVNNGVVSAIGTGITTVTAVEKDGTQYGVFTINVELKKENLVIRNGQNTNLTNYLNLSSNISNNITWKSSENSIATVSKGIVTGLKNGTVTITASGSDGTQYSVFTIDIVNNDITSSTLGTIRLGGADRYDTSTVISQAGWKKSSTYAVIATGSDYPDALSAAPLAKKYNAPILLTKRELIPQSVLTEIKRLNINHIFIAGGIGVVSETVEKQFNSIGITTERLGGKDRYETSVKIAQKLGALSGEIMITNGNQWSDALSASSIAAKKGIPILLTNKDTLPDSTNTFINARNFSKTYILGDTDLVSDNVESKLPNPERILGRNQYERNINIIKRFQNDIDFSNICIATGKKFADALSGSSLATMLSSAIVLVDNSDLQDITTQYASQNLIQVNNVYVFGQQGAVSDNIIKKLFNK